MAAFIATVIRRLTLCVDVFVLRDPQPKHDSRSQESRVGQQLPRLANQIRLQMSAPLLFTSAGPFLLLLLLLPPHLHLFHPLFLLPLPACLPIGLTSLLLLPLVTQISAKL